MRVFLLSCFLLFIFVSYGQNTIGVIKKTELEQEGYTLFAPNTSNFTYLIDNCGNLVKQWESESTPGLSAYLLENGNLLRTGRRGSSVFFAGGLGGLIEMFDWDGNLIWQYEVANPFEHQHHDVAPLPNGNVLVIVFEYIDWNVALAKGRKFELTNEDGFWVDKIIELEPNGLNDAKQVWQWRAIDHVVQDEDPSLDDYGVVSEHPELLDINFARTGGSGLVLSDWMHSNAIDYNEELDQILLNSRNFNEFFIIDHSTTPEEAAGHTGGKYGKGGDILYRWGNPIAYKLGAEMDQQFFGQHDAHWIDKGLTDEGKVFVFNNGIGRPSGTTSSIDIVDTPVNEDGSYSRDPGKAFLPTSLHYSYGAGLGDMEFFSARISSVDRQANGNSLICVGNGGDLIEIDQYENIVWRYVIPLSQDEPLTQGDDPGLNDAFRAYKYPLDYPPFIDNQVEIGEPIELNPSDKFCMDSSIEFDDLELKEVRLVNSLVRDLINIESSIDTELDVIDAFGLIHKSFNVSKGLNSLDLLQLNPGVYFIRHLNQNSAIFEVEKFVKF